LLVLQSGEITKRPVDDGSLENTLIGL